MGNLTIIVQAGTLVDNLTLSTSERWRGEITTEATVDDAGECRFDHAGFQYRVHITLVEQHNGDHRRYRLSGLPAVPEWTQESTIERAIREQYEQQQLLRQPQSRPRNRATRLPLPEPSSTDG